MASKDEENFVWVQDNVFGWVKVHLTPKDDATATEAEFGLKSADEGTLSPETRQITVGKIVRVKSTKLQGKVKAVDTAASTAHVELSDGSVNPSVPLADLEATILAKATVVYESAEEEIQIELDLNQPTSKLYDHIKERLSSKDIAFIQVFTREEKALHVGKVVVKEPKSLLDTAIIIEEKKPEPEKTPETPTDSAQPPKEGPAESAPAATETDATTTDAAATSTAAATEQANTTNTLEVTASETTQTPEKSPETPQATTEATPSATAEPKEETTPAPVEHKPEEMGEKPDPNASAKVEGEVTKETDEKPTPEPEKPPVPEVSTFETSQGEEHTWKADDAPADDLVLFERSKLLGTYASTLYDSLIIYVEAPKELEFAQTYDHILDSKASIGNLSSHTLLSISKSLYLRAIGVVGPAPSLVGIPYLDARVEVVNLSQPQNPASVASVRVKRIGQSKRCHFYYLQPPLYCAALDQVRINVDHSISESNRGHYLPVVKDEPVLFGSDGTRFTISSESNNFVAGVGYSLVSHTAAAVTNTDN